MLQCREIFCVAAADYEGDFTDEDGNLVGTCRQGVCYPYNSDYMRTAIDTVQQVNNLL